MLEKAVSEAQSSESRVQNFQQWIYHVDELLNEHLDNDTTVDDLPHDFQVRAANKFPIRTHLTKEENVESKQQENNYK